MVALIGIDLEAKDIMAELEQEEIPTALYAPDQIPSLTAMVLSDPSLTAMVLFPGAEKNWSMAHILAAAKQLQGRGYVIFFSPQNDPPKMIRAVSDTQELLALLRKPVSAASGTGSNGGRVYIPPVAADRVTKREWKPKPLHVPQGKILFVGVAGSQRRIGCTTHAIGLWHYCKKLGLDPAIVSSKEAIAEIAAPMRAERIQDGYRIEGIPFVVSTALAYDCYIIDQGTQSLVNTLEQLDLLLLVAGIKPWELPHTMAALEATKEICSPVLLSFASDDDAATLKPMFHNRRTATAPWDPDLWHPSYRLLGRYESLLFPILEWIMDRAAKEPVPAPTEELEQELENVLKGE